MSATRPLLGPYPAYPWAEVGVGDSRQPPPAGVWNTARWSTTATWSGVEPQWLDRSCDGMVATSVAGRERIGDPFGIGTGEVTFRNLDGWADMDDPPVDPATLVLRPGRAVRFGVDTATGRHVVFRGIIDEATPVYLPYSTDTATVAAIDALGDAGRINVPAVTPAAGDGESASARVTRILDAVSWPPSKRHVQDASTPLVATTLGAKAVDLLTRAADSCGGAVFGDLEGRVAFRHRDWQTYLPTTPPAATIGNVGPGDVCPQAWELSWRRGDVAVVATMGRQDDAGPVTVTVTDTAALGVLGPEPFDRLDLETKNTGDLTTLANRAIRVRGLATMPRVEAVVLDAATDPGDGRVVELMATARPETPTRLRCRLVTMSGRPVFDDEMFVTSARHTITEDGRWLCRLGLDTAAPFAAPGGRWGSAYWSRATWTVAPATREVSA